MNSIHRALLCGASVVAMCSAMSTEALAQASNSSSGIETVVVTGVRGSLRNSLKMKRNSSLVTDSVSSKDIGQLPDVTIAEELNRLPGVNFQRDRGNDSQASVRGLGPRFVFGLVNGREMASSEPNQNVRYEIYPSEILSAAIVYKTQDASLIPGGIAGTIDIRTIDPLNYDGPALQVQAGPQYNDEAKDLPNYSGLGFRGSAGYITHLTDNFAVAVAASFQREKNGFPSLQSWGENSLSAPNFGAPGDLSGPGGYPSGNPAGTPTPWGAQTETKELTQDREGLATAATWRINSELTMKADALYSSYLISENQMQQWYSGQWGNWQNSDYGLYHNPGSSFTLDSQNHVVAATLDATSGGSWETIQNMFARYHERHTVEAGGLNFDWTQGNWDAKLDLSHSEAWRDNRWLAFGTNDQYTPISTFDFREGVTPSVTTPGFDPAVPANNLTPNSYGQDVGPQHTYDQISAATFDATDTIGNQFLTAIDFGARLSDRDKEHHQYDYSLPTLGNNIPVGDLNEWQINAFTAPEQLYLNWKTVEPLVYGPNTGPTAPGAVASDGTSASNGFDNLPAHWRVRETTAEGYLKADFAHEFGDVPMDGSLGVRIENVNTTSYGYETSNGGASFSPITVSNQYTNFLPSLNTNFHLTDDQILRFGAGIATSRPPLDTLATGYTLNPIVVGFQPTGSGGDPKLKPFKADSVDLDYEWYFHEESLFALALYYKHLDTFIGQASSIQTFNGTAYSITSPANGPGGDLEGAELTFQTRFFFLPDFFKDFGTYMNFALVTSDIHEFTPTPDPLPMGGLSKTSGEFDLFYDRTGLELRAAFKFHARFTEIPGWTETQLYSLDPEKTLDLSASYQWNEHIGFRLTASNVTNEVSRSSTDNDVNDLARYDTFGRTYQFDVSLKY